MLKINEESSDEELPIEDEGISEEEEIVAHSDHDSNSEQDYTENEDSESESDDEIAPDFFLAKDKATKWYKTNLSTTSKVKNKNLLKILPGPKQVARGLTSEISALELIIDSFMIEEVVKCTNLYINKKKGTVEYQRARDARNTTKNEIAALLGLLYFIGAKRNNHCNVEEMWDAESGFGITRQVMSYKRFLFLLRCIRFDDCDTREHRKQTDKLAAIRPIFEKFVSNCKEIYSLGEYVTIDEKLEAFRGRCSFIQYIPNKPAKYGIKMFVLCDAKTHYMSNIEIYCGQHPEGPYKVQNTPTEIVKRLVDPIKATKRNLTTDNWYTSIPLAQILLKDYKLTFLGTLKKNKRELPAEFLPHKNREVKSSIFGFQKDLTIVSHVPKKNKSVILVSTMHDSGEIDQETKKPEIILDYNATKGAVDTFDQMCGSYSVKRITRRWPLVIFFSIMDMAGINAFILYNSNANNKKIKRRIFLKNLAISLMRPFLAERANVTSLPVDIRASLAKYKSNEEVAKEGEPDLK